jgi:hypothetical protein
MLHIPINIHNNFSHLKTPIKLDKKYEPLFMEDYFDPGFKTKPGVLVGSQTMRLYKGDLKEQAWEGLLLAGTHKNDISVVRNFDKDYIHYWQALMENPYIINISDPNPGEYLTKVIFNNPWIINSIQKNMYPESKLMVYFPTQHEQKLARLIGIPLHGTPRISNLYGTKSGIRLLAKEANILMPEGYVCSTYSEIEYAIRMLAEKFDEVIIKHDLSSGGRWSKKISVNTTINLKDDMYEILGKPFIEGKDIFVVEGWLKSKASLCAHIEILEGKEPIICAGWEQLMDNDGITYLGAGPLTLSNKAMQSFITQVLKLAYILKQKNAVGTYAPDFLVTADEEENAHPDSCVLIELNARVPVTAFPLEIVKQVKGTIGSGFCATQINLSKNTTFSQIKEILQKEKLLITEKNSKAVGVVPYNVGHLAWHTINMVAMADTLEETSRIVRKIKTIFE